MASYTAILAHGLQAMGLNADATAAFDTLTVETGARTDAIAARAVAAGVNLRRISAATHLGIALDETTTRDDIAALWSWFAPDGAKHCRRLPATPRASSR